MLPVAFLIALALVAGGLLYQLAGSRRDARTMPPPGRMIDIGAGRRLHLHCMGSAGPAVIFEAGIAASSLSWTHVQPRVAEFARACSYDRAGLAWSEAIAGPVTAARCAAHLEQLRIAAGIPDPVILVGHSYGAFVVQAYASVHPERVAGLVLVDPIFPADWSDLTHEQRLRLRGGVFLSGVGAGLARLGFVRGCLSLLARGSTGVPRRASRMFGSEAAQVLNRLVGEVQKLPPDVWPFVRSHWSQAKCFTSMARHLSGLPASAIELAACTIPPEIPVTVISAATQTASYHEQQRRAADCSTRGRHVIARGSGHWVHLDEPALVVESIRDMTQTIGTTGTTGNDW